MKKIREFLNDVVFDFLKRTVLFLKNFFDKKIFNNSKNTILFLMLLISAVLFLIQLYIIVFNNSVYNNNSDDILQYYVILEGFIRSIKEGSISFFDLNNYFGASLFSNLYYVPLDLFTLITLVLSYVMPTVIAVSLTEMIKIVVGVLLVSLYLNLKDYRPRTIFWVGLIYFVNGGTVSFMNFPAFLTMTVYLPLALIAIHYFFKKRYYVVPIYVVLVVFYNFYLAYMLLAFTAFAYLIEYFKFHQFKIKDFLIKGFSFLSLILLGVLMSSVVLLPAITFISEETIRSTVTFKPWIIDLKFIELKLFDIQVYIRYFAKMYSPQRPVSFRGFLGDYKLEHVSNYLTIIGFMLMLLVFFMKDKKARVYQIMFAFLLIFTIFPFFSSVFSGTYIMEFFSHSDQAAFPYNRWLNMATVFEVLIIAHVIETYRFESFKRWQIWAVGIPMLALGTYLVMYYAEQLATDDSLSGFVVDSLTYDRIFMIVSLVILGLAMVIVLFKKFHLMKVLILVEIVLAVGYMFTSGFGSHNRLDKFEEMNSVNDFLIEHIEEDQFSRVYVDMDRLNVEDRNFNQMTSFPTNTRIFHSWSDAETDAIANLLFGVNERQSKRKMNYYSYYLSSFLGYRYVVTESMDISFQNSSSYELIARNEFYALYEIKNVDSFYVYDQYMTYDELKTLKRNYSQITAERAFLKAVMIDEERYQDIYDFDDFIMPHVSMEDVSYDALPGSVRAYDLLYVSRQVDRSKLNDSQTQATYYEYDNFDIDFQSGEIALRDNQHGLDSYGEVFYVNEEGEEIACRLSAYDESRTLIQCGQFFSPIEKIYVEKVDDFDTAPFFVTRLERAISGRSYLVYDLENELEDIDRKVIDFYFDDYEIEKNFILDQDGNRINSINGMYIAPENVKRIYIYKTADLYNEDNLFSLPLKYSAFEPMTEDFIVDYDLVEDKDLVIQNSQIDLSFQYQTPSDVSNIVVIPVTYSDDWQFTSDQKYDKISVSGGFLGLVIPEGTESVDVTLKFVPKNIQNGLYLSLGGLFIFTGLVSYPYLIKTFKRGNKNDESKIDRTSI